MIIHDGRDKQRPMTIFASDGTITGGDAREDIRLILHHGSIHATGKEKEYRLVNFGEYAMTIGAPLGSGGIGRNELDMSPRELLRQMDDPAAPRPARLKAAAEFHSRVALPFASLVFAVLAVPLGIQSRRSGKSAGFSLSIGILLAYYILLALLRTLAERGGLPCASPLAPQSALLRPGVGTVKARLAGTQPGWPPVAGRSAPVVAEGELMGMLGRYIAQAWLHLLSLCLGSFVAIYLVLDMMDKVPRFLRAGGRQSTFCASLSGNCPK